MTMKFMACNHNIDNGMTVLFSYASGDVDEGIVIAQYDDVLSIFTKYNNKFNDVLPEDVMHTGCDVDVIDDELNAMMDTNAIVGMCVRCNGDLNAAGQHIDIVNDPLHVFDNVCRFNYGEGRGFVIWLGGVSAKVGRTGVKRHAANASVLVDNGAASLVGGNVWCGANRRGYNQHHNLSLTDAHPVNCEKCTVRYGAKHVNAGELFNDRLQFKDEFNKYPTLAEKRAQKGQA